MRKQNVRTKTLVARRVFGTAMVATAAAVAIGAGVGTGVTAPLGAGSQSAITHIAADEITDDHGWD
ncbi:hypothetical protein [Streptomyces sp. NPDC057287]|uniref:hypothetical protein n=1 Tax=Streptomyces sp. NPDC057287 TaxID=3346086 RepID=UPI0036344931